VDPEDANELWVTFSGYAPTKKVFHSIDAGLTFTNVTYNLPNVPVNGAVIDMQSEQHDMYIGTDVGVFVLDETAQQWIYYGAGLPNTMVSDLEIQYSSRKLRIGTFGRGVWENDLYSEVFSNVQAIDRGGSQTYAVVGNPVGDQLLINVHNQSNMHGLFVVYDAKGMRLKELRRTLHEGHYQITMEVADLATGAYVLRYESQGSESLQSVRFVKR
jgi:hypothetical protein